MKKAAVLGSPITHSLSPAIHNAAYRKLQFSGMYEAHEVSANQLDAFLEASLSENDWAGFSLTMPLKEQICLSAERLGIEIDERSKRISSANTLFKDGRSWKATSTDVSGFEYLLNQKLITRVAILGAGGTARAVVDALPRETKEIVIYRRNSRRDSELRFALSEHKVQVRHWSEIESAWDYPVVINTVPNVACMEIESTFRRTNLLVDALYSPWLPPLSRRQLEEGGELITGIDLLCAQAIDQIRFMTGKEFDNKEMFEFLKHVALKALS